MLEKDGRQPEPCHEPFKDWAGGALRNLRTTIGMLSPAERIEAAFEKLTKEYGFQMVHSQVHGGGSEVVYTKGETGLRITFDIREQELEILFWLPREGAAADEESFAGRDNHVFTLYDYLAACKPTVRFDGVVPRGQSLESKLVELSEVVFTHCNELITGAELPDLSSIRSTQRALFQSLAARIGLFDLPVDILDVRPDDLKP